MWPGWIGSAAELLLDSSLRITLVALLIGVMLLAARVRSSAMRHSAWTAVTAAMLLMPVLRSIVPAIAVPVPAPARAVFVLPESPVDVADPEINSTPASRPAVDVPAAPRAAGPAPQSSVRGPETSAAWLILLTAVYAFGVLFLLARLGIGWRAVTRLVRAATRTSLGTDTPVVESRQVATPLTAGVFSPSVVLPSSWREWPQEKLAAVLAHELAHVRRRDPLVAFAARLNCCVFWFHPLAWWLERRLGADAEHACDEAAVRQMGQPRRYAEILLDMADAVRRHGGRISWQGIGVGGNGLLGRRIDRIVGGELFSDPSRARRLGVALGCVAVILAVVACREQLKSVPPLREDPEVTQRLAAQKANEDFWKSAERMTAEQVDQLEGSLKRNTEDFEALKKLKIFYRASGQKMFGWNQMIARRRPHILWLIEHHPEHELALWLVSPGGDADGYAAAKKAWLNQTARTDVSVPVLSNAASFFQEHDPHIAEEVLLRARKLDPEAKTVRSISGAPSPTYWSSRLGRFYAQVMLGARNPADGSPTKPIDADPYARDVSRRLASSDDAALLATAGSDLARSFNDPARRQLGIQFLQRALQLDPQQRHARLVLFSTEDYERSRPRQQTLLLKRAELVGGEIERKVRAGERLSQAEWERLRGVAYDALASLPDPERFSGLAELADSSYMWAEHLGYTAKDEAGAKAAFERSKKAAQEALALARRLTDHPDRGTVIYRTNVALGAHALREGDRRTAVRYMLQATTAPPSARLASFPSFGLDGRLVNYLLKEGERETVAEFLEKSANLRTSEKERLLRDAAAIRDGRMPLSYQHMMMRAQ